jgi:putative spermidine/putrescine transport system substrate-binding protein
MPDFLDISKRNVTRRKFLAGTAAIGAGSIASPFVISVRSQEVLVVNTQGGEYQEIVERTVLKPFEKKFSVKITNDPTGTAAEDYAKIRASRGAPGFDVAATLTPAEVILGAKENLLEKLSEREVPNIKYLWDKSATLTPPYGVVHTVQFSTIMYNKDKIEKPDSWADYWEPQKRYGDKIKGHVIAFHPNNLLSVYALLFAAQLGGGGVDNMDPAWKLPEGPETLPRPGGDRLVGSGAVF